MCSPGSQHVLHAKAPVSGIHPFFLGWVLVFQPPWMDSCHPGGLGSPLGSPELWRWGGICPSLLLWGRPWRSQNQLEEPVLGKLRSPAACERVFLSPDGSSWFFPSPLAFLACRFVAGPAEATSGTEVPGQDHSLVMSFGLVMCIGMEVSTMSSEGWKLRKVSPPAKSVAPWFWYTKPSGEFQVRPSSSYQLPPLSE